VLKREKNWIPAQAGTQSKTTIPVIPAQAGTQSKTITPVIPAQAGIQKPTKNTPATSSPPTKGLSCTKTSRATTLPMKWCVSHW